MKNILLSVSILFAVFSAAPLFADEGFPGRAEYPDIPLYQKSDLAKDLNKVVVVDARSSLEFETLRIKDAVNIPVASKQFAQDVVALRKKTNKPIVFYCNGRSCYKSYKAAKISLKAGVKNVFAYDAGVFEWAKTYPQHAVLLGTSPMDPAKIIPKEKFHARLLEPQIFNKNARAAKRSNIMILDVRDLYQRAGVGFYPGIEKWVSMDDQNKLASLLKQASTENRTLYIYDEAGKQVRWLQYTLEQANIRNYFFMNKGAHGFYQEMI